MTKNSSPSKPKTAEDMTSDEWFRQLAIDTLDGLIACKRDGRRESARNAIADLYLGCKDYLNDEEAGVWAYLYEWARDETHALIEAGEEREATT